MHIGAPSYTIFPPLMVKRGEKYLQTSNIIRILVSNIIVDNSDVVGASPVGAAPTTSELFA